MPGSAAIWRRVWGPFDESGNRIHVSRMKLFVFLLALALLQVVSALAAGSIYDIPVKDIDGKATSLKPYEGKVLLIVNVASKCGYTPQYTGLEALYEKYKDKGLLVLGFPCNQFGGQEPGTDEQIKQFCSSKYQVTFPLFDKIEVNGPNRNPLYTMLAGASSPFPGNIKWNFSKFLIGRDGKILKRFESKVKPDSEELVQAVEAALAAK
jgi:glutathione peroxidase